MRVNCVICGELSLQNQEVSAAPCGHTFHSLCIIQWLERSKSCPQCRSKVTERTLNKLFFDPGCTDEVTDPDILQQQIDNLKFQVKLKEQEVKKVSEENGNLKAQTVALREEFRGQERTVRDRDTTILALKSQLVNVDRVTAEAKKAKEDAKTLREELKLLKGVEKVLLGTNGDVEDILQSSGGTNIKSLATFITVLKRELSKVSEDKNKLRTELAAATRRCKEATKLARSAHEEEETLSCIVKQLEEDNKSLEQENLSLKRKLQALEQAIASPSDDVRSSALHRLLSESPAPEVLKRLHSANLSGCVTPEVTSSGGGSSTSVVKKRRTTSESESTACAETTNTTASESESTACDVTTEEEETATASEEDKKSLVEIIDLTSPAVRKKKPSRPPASSSITPVRPLSDSLNIIKGTKGHKSRLFANPSASSRAALSSGRKVVGAGVGYDGLGGHYTHEEFPKPRLAPLPLPSKKKFITRKVGGGGSGLSSSRGRHNRVIQDFFKMTFD